ncbi:MAG: efflux RND transporter periplasmic adaptor subunit [Ktedonobacteraceae bacterium]|nr:efflux RND transporter periplasmic adaptor subunit [Ktedonobacteraceae bacterium]
MSQYIPRTGTELLPLPDFHNDEDLFGDDASSLVTRPHHRIMRIILPIVLLILLLAGVVLVVKLRTHLVYQTRIITSGDIALTVNANGLLHTNIYTVNFMGNGKLAAVNVTIGQPVKKNQILAKLDPTSLQNALNEARANVEVAQTALSNANANYDAIHSANSISAQAALTNTVRATPEGDSSVNTPSASPADPIPTEPLVVAGAVDHVRETEALGQIKSAQKALDLAQAQVATAQYNLNNTLLKAPHAGTIASLNGTLGGAPGTTFIQIVDPSSLQLQVNVDEAHIGAVTTGDSVSFVVDAYPDQSFVGNVVTVLPLGQSINGKVTYPVLITIVSAVSASIHLFPAMTAHATITTSEHTGVIVVPASALAFARDAAIPGTEASKQNLVTGAQMQKALARAKRMAQDQQQNDEQEASIPAVVLERNAHAKITAIPIVVGMTNGTEYEVLDGLSVGDEVLIGAHTSSN